MMLRFFGLGWASLMVVMATGCCTDSLYRGGFEGAPIAAACADCGGGGCDSCAGGGGGIGLLSYMKNALTCGSGCGEFYLHPWINDAPDDCDSCDDYGNWTGQKNCDSCGSDECSGARLGNLWGSRIHEGCGSAGGGEVFADEAYNDEGYVDDEYVDHGIVESRPGEFEGAIRDVQVFEGAVGGPQREVGRAKTVYNRRSRSRKTAGGYRAAPRR